MRWVLTKFKVIAQGNEHLNKLKTCFEVFIIEVLFIQVLSCEVYNGIWDKATNVIA